MKHSIRFIVATLLAILAFSLVGCGKKDLATVAIGKWSGNLPNGPVSFEFRSDKGFNAISGGAPASGTWEIDGDKIKMTLVKIGGTDITVIKQKLKEIPGADSSKVDLIDKPFVGTFSEDLKSLTVTPPGPGGNQATLTKEETK